MTSTQSMSPSKAVNAMALLVMLTNSFVWIVESSHVKELAQNELDNLMRYDRRWSSVPWRGLLGQRRGTRNELYVHEVFTDGTHCTVLRSSGDDDDDDDLPRLSLQDEKKIHHLIANRESLVKNVPLAPRLYDKFVSAQHDQHSLMEFRHFYLIEFLQYSTLFQLHAFKPWVYGIMRLIPDTENKQHWHYNLMPQIISGLVHAVHELALCQIDHGDLVSAKLGIPNNIMVQQVFRRNTNAQESYRSSGGVHNDVAVRIIDFDLSSDEAALHYRRSSGSRDSSFAVSTLSMKYFDMIFTTYLLGGFFLKCDEHMSADTQAFVFTLTGFLGTFREDIEGAYSTKNPSSGILHDVLLPLTRAFEKYHLQEVDKLHSRRAQDYHDVIEVIEVTNLPDHFELKTLRMKAFLDMIPKRSLPLSVYEKLAQLVRDMVFAKTNEAAILRIMRRRDVVVAGHKSALNHIIYIDEKCVPAIILDGDDGSVGFDESHNTIMDGDTASLTADNESKNSFFESLCREIQDLDIFMQHSSSSNIAVKNQHQ